jgi:hypothetical protein
MTMQETVDKYGEVRIARINGVAHDEKGVAIIRREIVDNQVVEHNVPEVHYRVSLRDANPVVGATVEEALAKVS